MTPELLAPAGDWDCVRAAIENGADAVYFGLDTGFNARARATNFTLDDLPRLMQLLHRRGLKAYATRASTPCCSRTWAPPGSSGGSAPPCRSTPPRR